MQVKLEEFRTGYVVVPLFEEASYGISNVIRGDMTDEEWRTWRSVSKVREVAQAIEKYKRSNQPIKGLSTEIYNVLTEKEVPVCLTNSERPIV